MKNNLRVWGLLTGIAVIALVAGGWFLGAQPMLASAATADASTASLVTQNQALQLKLAALARTAAKTDQLTAESEVLDKAVPSTLKPNTFIRRVTEIAAQDGVTVQSVAPGIALPYTPPASIQAASLAAAAAASAAANPAPTPTPTATAAPVAVAAAAPAPVLAKTDPLISSTDFAVVPMVVSVKGTADATLQFVKDIQNDERLFLVSGLSTSTDTTDSTSVTTQLSGSIYTLAR